ncbi:unnamed protein product [Dibothriocephalus latus]|uniref:Cadherin domain-containing protein n=1 Tax=Dibothriocephalus latus TaxID=60516 RepID=A0A3P6S6H3_DIBLA|nr:unnamed protein product [Dibothriocephalus latus]
MRLLTTHSADFNTKKKSTYTFKVRALFQSNHVSNHSQPIQLMNETVLKIRVIDKNDNCPFFTRDIFNWTVQENLTTFSPVGQVKATDADSGLSGQIYYYMRPEENIVPFRVDPRSGVVFPTKSLQISRGTREQLTSRPRTYLSRFEGLEDYSFYILAKHRGKSTHVSCSLVSQTKVNVHIVRLHFDQLNLSVTEITKVPFPGSAGSAYATVRTFYPGYRNGPDKIHVNIVEPEMAALFELVPENETSVWLLRLKHQLPSLALSSRLTVTLRAHDIRSSPADFVLHALSVPLLPHPSFRIRLPTEILVSVSEAAILNSTIVIVNPSLDFYTFNASYTFSRLDSNQPSSLQHSFKLTDSGSLIVTKNLDCELFVESQWNIIEIPFSVADRNNVLLSSMADSKFIITIEDLNEHDPYVSNDGAEISVPENHPVGSEVLRVIAFDPDFSNTRLLYILYEENKLPFIFSTENPEQLVLKTSLDAEIMPGEFHIKVKVSDSGLPHPRSTVARYIVRVLDTNEFDPVFVEKTCTAWLAVSSDGYIQSLSRNDASFELGRFFAEDLDRDGSGSVSIRIASTTMAKPCFHVDSRTGLLTLTCSNIGPPGSTVVVTLEATDGERVSSSPFELKIELIHIEHSHLSSGRVYHKSCQPSEIYETMQARKMQRAALEYLFTDSHQGTFSPKPELQEPPLLDLPTDLHIPENLPLGTSIIKFGASFPSTYQTTDTTRLIYGIEGKHAIPSNNNGSFPPNSDFQAFLLRSAYLHQQNPTGPCSIDQTMELVVAAPLDREAFSSFHVLIHVCVLQSTKLCTAKNVTIHIENIIDNPPYFIQPNESLRNLDSESHVFTISEDAAVGTRLGQVTATADDMKTELLYSLGSHKDKFRVCFLFLDLNYLFPSLIATPIIDLSFQIDRRTGRITLKQKLDRESLDSYLLIVEAKNNAQEGILAGGLLMDLALSSTPEWAKVRTATTQVLIKVLDENDNPPVFVFPGETGETKEGYVIRIPADLPDGAYIITLLARDADTDNNAVIQYSLFDSESGGSVCFACDAGTGVTAIFVMATFSASLPGPMTLAHQNN